MSHYELLLGGSSQIVVCDSFGQLEPNTSSPPSLSSAPTPPPPSILDFSTSLEILEQDITSACWVGGSSDSRENHLLALTTYDGLLALVDVDEQKVHHWIGCPDIGFESVASLSSSDGPSSSTSSSISPSLIASSHTGVHCFDLDLNRTVCLWDAQASSHVTSSDKHVAVGFPGTRELVVVGQEIIREWCEDKNNGSRGRGEEDFSRGRELRLPYPVGRGDLVGLELSSLKTVVAAAMQDGRGFVAASLSGSDAGFFSLFFSFDHFLSFYHIMK